MYLHWFSNECLDVYDCTFDFNGYAKAVAFGVYAPTLFFDDYDQTLDLDVYALAQISMPYFRFWSLAPTSDSEVCA